MQGFDDEEKKLTCPYDQKHEIYVSKLQKHLVKCRKNYPNTPMMICDYNSEHRIHKPELQYHLENCPDRFKDLARDKDLVDAPGMTFPIRNIDQPVVDQWGDEECEYRGYNAEEELKNRDVLRTMQVEQPAVKKQFRRDEQRRLMELRAPNPSVPANNGPPVVKEDRKENVISEEKPELSLEQRIRDLTVYKTAEDAQTPAAAETAGDTRVAGVEQRPEAVQKKDEDVFQFPKNGRKKKKNNKNDKKK